MAENCAPLLCDKCRHGKHHQCWGHVGPMTTHPDSLPLCTCGHRAGRPGGSDSRALVRDDDAEPAGS